MASMSKSIRVNASSAEHAGQEVVLSLCKMIAEVQGDRQSLDAALGAMSAAVSLMVVVIGEAGVKRVVDSAVDAGLEAARDQRRMGAH